MKRHIPGTPTIVIKNMPGAAGLTSMNFIYTAAQQAIFWNALRTAGIDDRLAGFGRLLREF